MKPVTEKIQRTLSPNSVSLIVLTDNIPQIPPNVQNVILLAALVLKLLNVTNVKELIF